jgi:hypothetical protein
MKITLLFCANLLLGLFTFSQNLPEIPLKEDMIYYSIEQKLSKGSKKCLINYIKSNNNFNFGGSVKMFVDSMNTVRFPYANKNKKKYGLFEISGVSFNETSKRSAKSCGDTLELKIHHVSFPKKKVFLPDSYFFNTIRNIKKRLNPQNSENLASFSFMMYIYFVDKENYSIAFKGFEYTVGRYENGQPIRTTEPMETLYKEYSSKKELTGDEIQYFTDVDFIVHSFARMFVSNLNYSIKASDL